MVCRLLRKYCYELCSGLFPLPDLIGQALPGHETVRDTVIVRVSGESTWKLDCGHHFDERTERFPLFLG